MSMPNGTIISKKVALIKSYYLFVPVIIIASIIIIGITGFMIIEGFNLLDAAYMTVVTVTTVGYEEVKPLSTAGRIFNILLIISSFATFAFALDDHPILAFCEGESL